MSNEKWISKKKIIKKMTLRVLAVVGTTFGFFVAALLIVSLVIFRGPYETARAELVRMLSENSQMKWIPGLFLPKEQVDEIINYGQIIMTDDDIIPEQEAIDSYWVTEDIEIMEVSGEWFRGSMMIIHNPSKVFLGTAPELNKGTGQTVQEMISNYSDVIGGINAGGFINRDTNTSFNTTRLGLVISDGQVVMCESGDYDEQYHITGITDDNMLVLGNLSANEAVEMGIRDAVYSDETMTGPFLIVNGTPMIEEVRGSSIYDGVNPRTVIGQRQDGAIVFLVVDGFQADSFGVTFTDLIDLLLDYDVYNACAMDGGTSSQMVCQGEILNHPYSGTPIEVPTAWMVRQ